MTRLLSALALLALAGCANQAALGPPRSTDPASTTNGRELEPPGSLPPGFTTNHPIAPATGVLGRTTTAP